MSARKAILVPAILLLMLAFTVPVTSEPSNIIVNNADATKQESVSINQDMVDSTVDIGPRVVVQYARAVRHNDLATMPSTLGTLLVQMPDRIIVQYAHKNRGVSMVYPIALFNDTIPPQVSEVAASGSNGIITWTTDEFATSIVLYGTQTGVYTGTISDSLYVKQHEVTLPGLESGTTYYYKTRSTDRSGNTATSSEYSFTAQVSVYLPVVIRNQ